MDTRDARAGVHALREMVELAGHVRDAMAMEAFYRAVTLFLIFGALGRPLLGLIGVALLWRMSTATARGFQCAAHAAVEGPDLLLRIWLEHRARQDAADIADLRKEDPVPPAREFAEEARRRAELAKQRAGDDAAEGAARKEQ